MEKSSLDISKYLSSRKNASLGIESKFWINIAGQDFLFKYFTERQSQSRQPTLQMRNFNEVLISEICKKVGINCVEALFAKAVLAEGFEGDFSLNARGCLIKSYLTKDIIESIPFEDIGAFYCEKNDLGYSEFHCPSSICEALRFFCEENKYVLDPDVSDQLKAMALIDYITGQTDRHNQNIELLSYVKNGEKHLRLAPLFDNGRSFGSRDLGDKNSIIPSSSFNIFYMIGGFDLPDSEHVMSVANGIAYVLRNDRKLQELYKKIKEININDEINDLISKFGEEISIKARAFINHVWNTSIENIDNALIKFEDKTFISKVEAEIEKQYRKEYVNKNKLLKYDWFLNYRCSKQRDENVSFFEYKQQDEKFRKEIQDWKDLKTDIIPNRRNHPFLNRQFPKDEMEGMRKKIESERSVRSKQMYDYKSSDIGEKYPHILDADATNRAIWRIFTNKEVAWILYGDDCCQKPTIEQAFSAYEKKKNKFNSKADIDQGRE